MRLLPQVVAWHLSWPAFLGHLLADTAVRHRSRAFFAADAATRGLRPMRGNLPLQKCHAAGELVHAVNAVFDADPSVESSTFEFAKNGVVIIEALANFAMSQAFGVAQGTAFLAAQVFERAFGEVAIAGVHGDNAM